MDQKNKAVTYQLYSRVLTFLFILFLFRVFAQLVQKFFNIEFLPPFEAWYSGALAYPWLLFSQAVIVLIMLRVIFCFRHESVVAVRKQGIFFTFMGALYMSVMVFRLVAGFTFAQDHPWLGAHIPAFFHIVLASFVLLVGHFHLSQAPAVKK